LWKKDLELKMQSDNSNNIGKGYKEEKNRKRRIIKKPTFLLGVKTETRRMKNGE
jgi:hypothetical protein